jgi:hypothetical protein
MEGAPPTGPLAPPVVASASLLTKDQAIDKVAVLARRITSVEAVLSVGSDVERFVGGRSAEINESRPVWVVTLHGTVDMANGEGDVGTAIIDAQSGNVTDECRCDVVTDLATTTVSASAQ